MFTYEIAAERVNGALVAKVVFTAKRRVEQRA